MKNYKIIAPGEFILDQDMQIIYLDFDGESTYYQNDDLGITLDINVDDSGMKEEEKQYILHELSSLFADDNVIFTTEKPTGTTQYSTIFIGGTNDFSDLGNFRGISETIDKGNRNKSDCAFVITVNNQPLKDTIDVISHEVNHLLGMEHQERDNSIYDYTYKFTEQEGSGIWNDTIDTADNLGYINSELIVEGNVQLRYGGIDNDWYAFVPTTNKIKWEAYSVSIANTVTLALFSPAGELLCILTNSNYASRSGILQLTPYATYYIHCSASTYTGAPYKFSLAPSNSTNNNYNQSLPDLAFYKPSGWSSKLVCYPDQSQSGKQLYSDVNTYLKLAVVNNGKSSADSSTISVYVDNYFITKMSVGDLDSGYYRSLSSINLGTLSAGKHKVTVELDSGKSISEKNEKNNIYTHTITVKQAPLPDLKFYKPKGWQSSLNVYSTSSKTMYADENIYLDFAAINDSLRPADPFYAYIYVDGVYFRNISFAQLNADYYQKWTYISLGNLSAGKHTITVRLDGSNSITEASEKNNVLTKSITVKKTPLPDLKFYKPKGWKSSLNVYSTSSKTMYADENIYLDFAVINDSLRPADPFYAYIYVDGVYFRNISFAQLNADYHQKWTYISLGNLSAGKHTITVRLDDSNSITEASEKNNVLTKSITVKKTPLPDLKFYKPKGWKSSLNVYSTSSTTMYADENIYLDFAVINDSLRPADPFYAHIYVDGVYFRNISFAQLNADYHQKWTYISLGNLSAGKHTITVRLDDSNSITEASEKNNVLTKSITVKKTPLPDLKFYKPKGWKSSVNIYSANGNSFYSNNEIYLNFSIANNSIRSIATSSVGIYIDDIFFSSIDAGFLSPNDYANFHRITLGNLSAGKHKITIKLDYDEQNSESNEKNNIYSKTISVKASPEYSAFSAGNAAQEHTSKNNLSRSEDWLIQGTVAADDNLEKIFFDIPEYNSMLILDFDENTDSALAADNVEINFFNEKGIPVDFTMDSSFRLYCDDLANGIYELNIKYFDSDSDKKYSIGVSILTPEI